MSGYKNDLSPIQTDALKAFQERLDADIAPLKEDGKSIILWGVELVPNAPKVDVILLKFLRAREFKVEEAAQMLVNSLKWRKEFGVDKLFEEKYPEAITSLGFIHKTDKDGRPVMYNIYGNIKPKEAFDDQGGIERFVRWRVQLMEKAILRLDMDKVEDMVVIHDYDGVSMLSMDKNTKLASKTLITLFQDNYPELLARKFFVNVPWFFESVFNVATAFVSARTKEKFVVCAKGSLREKLLVNIPVENLPTGYGGLSQLDRKTSSGLSFPQSDEKATEVTIEEGHKHIIEKEVEAGETIAWEFTAFSNDIQFSVTFLQTTTTGESTTPEGESTTPAAKTTTAPINIEAVKKTDQHAGTHVASESGKYVLTWENPSSFFGKRQRLYYKVFVVKPSVNNNNNENNNNNNNTEDGEGTTTTTTTEVVD